MGETRDDKKEDGAVLWMMDELEVTVHQDTKYLIGPDKGS